MTSTGRQVLNRWGLLALALAAVLVAVLAMRPAAAQTSCGTLGDIIECTYPENGTALVYDLDAASTPGAVIAWTLVEGDDVYPDDGAFRIDQQSGVLTFKSPPNFESPTDGTAETGTGNALRDNIYRVKVKLEVDTDAGRTTTEQGVTVTVTDSEENGSVSLNNLQPQVRELITALLSDPDGSVVESTWQWSSSSSRSSGYTDIAGATASAYRPVAGDTGMYLRVTATYTDGQGAEIDTAMTESAEPVRAETGVDNVDPAFGEDDNLNTAGRTTTRAIDENTPAGTNIGPPVAATDDDLDVLTYSLSDGADQGKFAINAANGQLMTKASLNFETLGEPGQCAATGCVVEVTVKDPLGNRVDDPALDTITVTISVNDVNEAPSVTGPVLLIRHAEGGTNLVLDSDPNTNDVQPETFGATDPDRTTTFNWELSGPDASKFMIGTGAGTAGTAATSEPLQFRATPDFESRGDANKDNVYQVTVVARDPQLATGSRDLTIRVTNAEESGSVSLSHIQPEVATSLTASHSDPDKGITGLKWQWMRTIAGTADSPATCDTSGDGQLAVGTLVDTDAAYVNITGRTTATYKPTPADEGKCLRVTATYDDTVRNKDDESTVGTDESLPTVVRDTSESPVRAAVSPNDRPYFEADVDNDDDDSNALPRVTSYTRYVQENQDDGTAVKVAANGTTAADNDNVKATDTAESTTAPITPDDVDSLQYELGGASKDYFRLTPAGLIAGTQVVTIETAKELDREDKDRHVVTVKATDPSGGTATVTVTIIIVNIDEKPEIDAAGPMHVMYMENGKAAVANYMASDPEGKAIVWTVLGGDGTAAAFDAEDLKVNQNSGPRTMLAFESAPNYERPTGATDSDSNIYTVTLRAAVNDADETGSPGDTTIVATEMDTVQVMVAVTDVPEAPAFSDDSKTLSFDEHVKGDPLHRNVGSRVTATDSDGAIHLTYSLSGTDPGYFTIVPATGQIKTMKRLDYETKNSFRVVVTATDPTGLSDTIDVTIEVDDVAEAPVITPGGLSINGVASQNYNENGTAAVATYTAVGENVDNARWTLEGADRGDFTLSTRTGASTMLRFGSSPNFEAPTDANTDNVYMVTLKATVGSESATQEVTVTVTNVEEDGTVRLSPTAPRVDVAITASVTDLDRGVTGEKWQWSSSNTKSGTYTNIPGASSGSYTPEASDEGMYLRATASYTDGEGSGKSATSESTGMVAAAAAPVDSLLVEYDPNDDGTIEKVDMRRAVANFFGASPTLTKAEMRRLVGIYFS